MKAPLRCLLTYSGLVLPAFVGAAVCALIQLAFGYVPTVGKFIGWFIALLLLDLVRTSFSKKRRASNRMSQFSDRQAATAARLAPLQAYPSPPELPSRQARLEHAPSITELADIDQRHYDLVASEMEVGKRNQGLWARAMAETGDEDAKTKARYINLRVAEMTAQEQRAWSAKGQVAPERSPEEIEVERRIAAGEFADASPPPEQEPEIFIRRSTAASSSAHPVQTALLPQRSFSMERAAYFACYSSLFTVIVLVRSFITPGPNDWARFGIWVTALGLVALVSVMRCRSIGFRRRWYGLHVALSWTPVFNYWLFAYPANYSASKKKDIPMRVISWAYGILILAAIGAMLVPVVQILSKKSSSAPEAAPPAVASVSAPIPSPEPSQPIRPPAVPSNPTGPPTVSVAPAFSPDVPASAVDYIKRGVAKNESGDHDGAITDFNRAIELVPKSTFAYNDRGIAKMAKGDYDGAIADFNIVGGLDPKATYALYNRGLAKKAKGDFDGAIADFTRAIELDPKDANAYDNRGLAKRENGDFDGAITDFNHAIKLDPKSALAYIDRGIAKMAKGDHDGAIVDFTLAIELDPKDAEAYIKRGDAKDDSGDHDGAIADFTRAIELDPKNSDAYVDRAGSNRSSGKLDAAIADDSYAIALDPNYAFAYEELGKVAEIQGHFQVALVDYDRAVALESYFVPNDTHSTRQPISDLPYLNVMRQLMGLRLGQAPTNFPAEVAGWKPSWVQSIGQFVAGTISETALLASAEKSDVEPVSGQKCEALYYIGMMRFIKGDLAGASAYWQKCTATGEKDYDEYGFARAGLTWLP